MVKRSAVIGLTLGLLAACAPATTTTQTAPQRPAPQAQITQKMILDYMKPYLEGNFEYLLSAEGLQCHRIDNYLSSGATFKYRQIMQDPARKNKLIELAKAKFNEQQEHLKKQGWKFEGAEIKTALGFGMFVLNAYFFDPTFKRIMDYDDRVYRKGEQLCSAGEKYALQAVQSLVSRVLEAALVEM